MNIIIVGCGRIGSELAYRLYKKGHLVTIIDQLVSAFDNLPSDFIGRTVEGEALQQSVLHRAGMENADGVAVVTTSDSINAVVAHVARTYYNIPNVVVRNFDPRFRPMYETLGLQVVSSSSWGAQRLEEMLYHAEIRTVFSAGNGEVEIYEFAIPEGWADHQLGDLFPDDECTPVSLTRAGRAMIPNCDTILEESDVILISATFDGIEALRKTLYQGQEGK